MKYFFSLERFYVNPNIILLNKILKKILIIKKIFKKYLKNLIFIKNTLEILGYNLRFHIF
jgi:hypothetical protein